MINKTPIEKSSWINEIHPSSKIANFIICVSVIALSNKMTTLIISLIVVILMAFTTKLRVSLVIKKLIAPMSFLLFLWIILPFSGQSQHENSLFFLTTTGSILALKITFKTMSISLLSILLISTMEMDTLGYSLRFIRVPKKMVTLISITYRYVFLIEEEYIKLSQAIKLRGFEPKTNMHTYKTYSYIMGILIVRAHDRAKNIYNAMICRNFSGDFFTLKTYVFNWQSNIFTIFTVLLTITLFFSEIKF